MSSGSTQLSGAGPLDLGDFDAPAPTNPIVVANGTVLQKPMVIAGRVSITSVGGVSYVVSYGATFAAAPVVVVDIESTVPYFPQWTVSSITATGFTLSAGVNSAAPAATAFPAGVVFACSFVAVGTSP